MEQTISENLLSCCLGHDGDTLNRYFDFYVECPKFDPTFLAYCNLGKDDKMIKVEEINNESLISLDSFNEDWQFQLIDSVSFLANRFFSKLTNECQMETSMFLSKNKKCVPLDYRYVDNDNLAFHKI